MRFVRLVTLAVLGLGCSTTRAASPQPVTLAIVGANVISMTAPQTQPEQTILIANDRIVAVMPSRDAVVPSGARVIDGRGLFVIPGLADMHVHMSEDDLPLFLANGVTTVREMNGTSSLLALRGAIARGEKLGPRMIVAGPLLAGVKQRWRHKLITTPEEATTEVESEIHAGYDEIKVYDGLTATTYAAIVEAAKKGGKRFVGHVPEAVGLANALDAGQSTIEHGEMIANAAGHPPDAAKIGELVSLLRRHGTWFTPTLGVETILSTLGSDDTNALFASAPLDLVDSGTRGWWESLRERKSGPNGAAYLKFKRDFVRAASEAGVPFLAGTDTPNPLMVPGFGIHIETKALTAAGLTPYRILQMLTSDPARYLGDAGKFGVVAAGATADLVLLERDPLAGLDNLRAVRGVVVRGRWLDRAALDAGVSTVRERMRK